MKYCFSFLLLLLVTISSQSIYFPPLTGNQWENLSPSTLNWDTTKIDSLYSFLLGTNTKAFLVLKDGKIVLEKYFGSFTRDSNWYWASAAKSLTAFLVGIAKQEGLLSLDDSTSKYLGPGWTSLTPKQEGKIKIIHQLTMTSGLDDGVPDPYCTLPSCLVFEAAPNTRWAYHNAPYTLLDGVITSASGQNLNMFMQQRVKIATGMNGVFLPSGYNNVFYSTPRSMARFGLLMLNKGSWSSTPILTDTTYFREMTNTSNLFNKSYGYLWWLNGKELFMLPQTQIVFPGMLSPDAPHSMTSALGKNGQILNIVPELNLVTVRMGDAPGTSIEVPTVYNNDIWKILKQVIRYTPTSVNEATSQTQFKGMVVYPNPATDRINFLMSESNLEVDVYIYSVLGEKVAEGKNVTSMDISHLSPGVFQLITNTRGEISATKFVKTR